jgi:hypothetical protein
MLENTITTEPGSRSVEMTDGEHVVGRVGDHVSIESHRLRGARREGEIIEVLGPPGAEYYRVRWSDGHESVFHPGGDALIPEAAARARAREARARRERRQAPAPPPPAPPEAPPGPRLHARAGDRLVVQHHHLGEPDRDAEILEVLGDNGEPPYRVRWSDSGREAIVRPGSDAYVDHLTDHA